MYIIVSATFILIYLVMAFINIWCIAAMLWLAFDRAFYEQYTLRRTKIEMEMRKRNMKIIKGGKE